MLGGVPRRSFFHSGNINFRNLSLVRDLVEDETLKGVVDSVWDMEDVLEVSRLFSTNVYFMPDCRLWWLQSGRSPVLVC